MKYIFSLLFFFYFLYSNVHSQPEKSKCVLKPIDKCEWDRGNYALHSYLNDIGDWSVRGTPQENMKTYSTERKFDILSVISYSEGENEGEPWVMFGNLRDGSVFHFHASCDYTGFDCQGGGVITYSPNWTNLLANLNLKELKTMIKNLNTSSEFISFLKAKINQPCEVSKHLVTALGHL